MAAYSSSYSLCCAHVATKPVLFARVSQNTRPESILMSRGAPAASRRETLPFVTGASRSASHSSRSKTRTRVEGRRRGPQPPFLLGDFLGLGVLLLLLQRI